jgi:hypothetical protein
MISAVTSNLSGAGSSASSRVAKIDALTKQASTLRQQLADAHKATDAPSERTKTNSLSQEIISIQAQIERLILDSQLSKLMAQRSSNTESSTSHAIGPSSQKAASKGKQADLHQAKSQDPYSASTQAPGNIVDVQA